MIPKDIMVNTDRIFLLDEATDALEYQKDVRPRGITGPGHVRRETNS